MDAEEIRGWARKVSDQASIEVARIVRAAGAGWTWDPELLQKNAGLVYAAYLVESIAQSMLSHEEDAARGGAR
jgi:hypothetical protein